MAYAPNAAGILHAGILLRGVGRLVISFSTSACASSKLSISYDRYSGLVDNTRLGVTVNPQLSLFGVASERDRRKLRSTAASRHPALPCLASGRGQSARAGGWCVSQRLPRLRTRGAGNSPSIQFYSPPFVAGSRLTQPGYLASPPLEACFSPRFRRHSATCSATREAFGILIGGRKPSKNLGPGERAKFVGDSICVAGPGPCLPRHSQFFAGCAAFG